MYLVTHLDHSWLVLALSCWNSPCPSPYECASKSLGETWLNCPLFSDLSFLTLAYQSYKKGLEFKIPILTLSPHFHKPVHKNVSLSLSLRAAQVITVVTSRENEKDGFWKTQLYVLPTFPMVWSSPWVSQGEFMERECQRGNGSVTLFHSSLQLFILSSQPAVWIICPHLITFD